MQDFPKECCGALLGDFKEGVKIVREVRPLPNTFSPNEEFEMSVLSEEDKGSEVALVGQERRYMVSPETMFQLMREERKTGLKILGFYHSHPNHPAIPSEYDRTWAMNWYTYIIVSVLNAKPSNLTAWVLNENSEFQPEEITQVNGGSRDTI